ncbi:MAG: TIM barrel protein [Acidimicrobiales bacterium]
MQLRTFMPLWGLSGPPLGEVLGRIADAGYDGLEGPAPEFMATLGWSTAREAQRLPELLAEHGLEYRVMIFTHTPDFSTRWGGIDLAPDATHVSTFDRQLDDALSAGACAVTLHGGADRFGPDEARAFIEHTLTRQEEVGVTIAHETHRMRILYNPFRTAALLEEYPSLRIVADFSHWVCVCERLLDDCAAELALACSRADHIHGRVGFPQGPQVNDPSAPENGPALEAHEAWWAQIVAEHSARGEDVITFDPEYGPPDYMPVLPFTAQPVSDLWSVRSWAVERFSRQLGEPA